MGVVSREARSGVWAPWYVWVHCEFGPGQGCGWSRMVDRGVVLPRYGRGVLMGKRDDIGGFMS